MTSVIVPAHDEERVIGRLLDGLLGDADDGEFDVIVVSNGSTDGTATAAARPGVRVIELAEASKHLALLAGDRAASGFPRLYVDADVELDTASARALVAALQSTGVHAVAPRRELRLTESSWAVREYYRVWNMLPAVREGLFGRGVLGVSETGYARIAERGELIADDLYLHSRFAPSERAVVAGAHSVVHAPTTLASLVTRRVRAAQGSSEMGRHTQGETVTTASSTGTVIRLAARRPRLWPSLAVFVAVTLCARARARWMRRRGNAAIWLRDESSRA